MNTEDKWNKKHIERIASQKAPTPNPRLTQQSDYFRGGTALELACGLGGNSLYLARNHYQVQAIDISEVAIAFLKERVAEERLNVQAEVGDLTELSDLQWLNHIFDLVVITYYLNRELFPIVKDRIKKDGYFFMETYYQSPKAESQKVSNRFKLQPKELLAEFDDWNILFFEEDSQVGRQTIFCQKW